MARFSKRNKNKKKGDKTEETKKNNRGGWDAREANSYKVLIKENEDFDKYYKLQGILSEEEYDLMKKAFQADLPTTFRITGTRKQALELLETLENKFIPELQQIEIEGETIPSPEPISFYPNKFGWKVKIHKNTIKKSEKFKSFHQFLVSESEVGNISRQEEVSMIPPLLLNVQPHHIVLDMCAAPGSKTGQLIEALHEKDVMPKGMIIANDASEKRCFTLIHQIKRLKSPNFIVTNHEAQFFPNIKIEDNNLKYDRILCDVPCSGDGTLRKNYLIWKEWNKHQAYALNKLQCDIASRAIQLAKVGGRIVYSTCSINPIENEAVVATLLNRFDGKIKLIDVKHELPGLKSKGGVKDWKVIWNNDEVIENYDALPPRDKTKKWVTPSLFPPENINELPLERCLRIYPHLQDTGGFFIAVFEKVEELSGEMEKEVNYERNEVLKENEQTVQEQVQHSAKEEDVENEDTTNSETTKRDNTSNTISVPPKKRLIKEEPFILMNSKSPELENIKKHFHLNGFPDDLFMVRSDTDHNKTITLVSEVVKKVVQSKDAYRLKFVNLGMKAFYRTSDKYESKFRLHNDSIHILLPSLNQQLEVMINRKDLKVLLDQPNPLIKELSQSVREKLEELKEPCSMVVTYRPENDINIEKDDNVPPILISFKEIGSISFPLWKAQVSVNLNLNMQDVKSVKTRFFGNENISTADA